MRIRFSAVSASIVSGAIVTAAFAQSLSSNNAQTKPRYLPEYTASGDLVLPKNFHEWVYVGSPLTPNALNGGKAGFPEFHNVYIEPGSYEIYKKTFTFPEGTIMFKDLQLTLPGQNPDGSRTEPSGRGYFPSMAAMRPSRIPSAMPIPADGGTTISIIMSQKLQLPK